MRRLAASLLLACGLFAQTAQEWLQEGIAAYKAAQYDEAIDNLKQAIAADPKSVPAHQYLAAAYAAAMKTREAQQEFARVLELDPKNIQALSALAALTFQERLLSESKTWSERLLQLEPANKEAHYSLGVIAWSRFYPAYREARTRAGLKPEDPGPFKDKNLRAALHKEWEPVIQEGMEHLQRAIDLDPQYDAAMSYLNLLIRERADLADNQYAYLAEIAKADAWVKKASEIKKRKP